MLNPQPFINALPPESGWRVWPHPETGDVVCRHPSGAEFVVSGMEILHTSRRFGDLESSIRSAAKAALERNRKDRWIFERCAM